LGYILGDFFTNASGHPAFFIPLRLSGKAFKTIRKNSAGSKLLAKIV
jgi:hypothetical protein